MRHRARLWLSLTVGLLAACGGPTEPVGPPPLLERLPRALTAGEQLAIDANNQFAFQLLTTVAAAEAGKNVFISPLSVSTALGMVMVGARGETRDAMARTLGFGATSQGEINTAYQGLIALLHDLDPQVKFTIANSIWSEQTFPIAPGYLTEVHQYFDAEAQALDFSAPASLGIINGWVNQKTNGKIPTILNSIDPSEILFAINAIYFKGLWRTQFKPSETTDGPFHQSNGSTQTVRFMHRKVPTPHYQGAGFEAVDLWYGGGAHTMTIIVPTGSTTADQLASRLTATDFTQLTTRFTTATVDLALPKLKLQYQRSLGDDLQALGMGIAFSDLADLSGISQQGRLTITRVEHKTFVDVNEEGTEAAAVTAVGVGTTSAPQVVTLKVDRPFLIALRERLSGTIFFLGRIESIP